jgi:ribulose 1,5-bisphosphate synthetase/thiazole synthase
VSEQELDVVEVGAGPAGEVCAGRLAGNGASVAPVERELVGGEVWLGLLEGADP